MHCMDLGRKVLPFSRCHLETSKRIAAVIFVSNLPVVSAHVTSRFSWLRKFVAFYLRDVCGLMAMLYRLDNERPCNARS
jgi:hypothetical protein